MIVSNSAAKSGGGGYSTTNINCTIAANEAPWGGGLFDGAAYNSILVDNTPANYYRSTINYSCTTPEPGGAGNLTNDPGFLAPAAGDYRLSPCPFA